MSATTLHQQHQQFDDDCDLAVTRMEQRDVLAQLRELGMPEPSFISVHANSVELEWDQPVRLVVER